MSNNKELKQLMEDGKRKGWIIEKTNGGHYRWVNRRTGAFFFASATPSDWRAMKNIRAKMNRAEVMGEVTRH